MMCDSRLFEPQITNFSRDRLVCVAPVSGFDQIENIAAEILKDAPKEFILAGLSFGGIVAMIGPFIDTIIICTLTGLTILVTGTWHHTEFYLTRIDPSFAGEMLNGSLLTSLAFKNGLSWLFPFGDKIITLGVLLFAISTVISWSFYGDRATEYLFGDTAIPIYRSFYILFVFIGAIASLEAIWAFGDAALGFMTFPNLISIILLSGVLKKMTKEYFELEHKVYK